MIVAMIIGILAVIVSFILFCKYQCIEDIPSTLLCIIMSMCIGFVTTIVVGMLFLILPMKTEYITTQSEIANLQDSSSLHGSFFLGSGYINNQMTYTCYLKNSDESYSLHTLDAQYVFIKYTDKKPYIEYLREEPIKNCKWNWFAIDIDFKNQATIYVPRGSILQNYTLDAK